MKKIVMALFVFVMFVSFGLADGGNSTGTSTSSSTSTINKADIKCRGQISSIDAAKCQITVTSKRNNTDTVVTVDAKVLSTLKVGDRVTVLTDGTIKKMEKKPAPANPDVTQ